MAALASIGLLEVNKENGMNILHLVKMANQIGAFFETMPDRQQALFDLASHLKRSWEPRMRRQLLSYAVLQNEAALKPIVCEAIRLHATLLK